MFYILLSSLLLLFHYISKGTYGDVITVYDDEGNQFAIKLFQNDDEDEEDYDDESTECSDDEEDDIGKAMDIGALREISILRLLRGENSHPNIIQIHDFKQSDDVADYEDGGYNGNDIMSNMGLVMPLYHHGNLSKAIDSNMLTNKRMKVQIAHGILCAVDFLHSNGIIHRDIKGDNVMLDFDEKKTGFFPVLIDFSLAKIIEPQVYMTASNHDDVAKIKSLSADLVKENTHTPECGTPTYRAPEVVSQEPYHLASDMYSVGVVLLELLRGKTLEVVKDKDSLKLVKQELEQLPDQPFANLVRGLLEVDPEKRLSAKKALQSDVFTKFGILTEESKTKQSKIINIMEALPFDHYDENDPSNNNKTSIICKDKVLQKRMKLIRRIAHELGSVNELTIQAALMYSQQLSQLECCDDLKESQALCDCVVLAHQFFEKDIWNLREIERIDSGIFRDFEWSAETYIDTESTLLMLVDFCLYPRQILRFE